jgi:hypothetical protein
MKVKVTKPDGTIETLGPFITDDTGGTTTLYTPTQLGNYTFQMSFPGQTLAGNNPVPGQSALATSFVGDYFEPSTSNVATLIAQETPTPSIPANPLPTSFWTRPINAENNNWYSIGGNWLGFGGSIGGTGGYGWYNDSSNYNAWTTAPMTAHILWTKPEGFGGTAGGEIGGSETGNYYSTRQYERMFAPVILNGVLYYEVYPGSSTNPTGFTAVNLQTGQTLWTDNTPVTSSGTQLILRCGQILNYISPNQFGTFAYLWTVGTPAGIVTQPGTTTLNMYDAATGSYILSVVNGTSPSALTEDAGGDLIGYFINSTVGTQIINGVKVTTTASTPQLECWNSSQCIIVGTNGIPAWEWRPTQNAQIPFKNGIMWSMPVAANFSGNALPLPLGFYAVNSGVIILDAVSETIGNAAFTTGFTIDAGYSATTGQQLWIANRTYAPFTRIAGSGQNTWLLDGNGVYVVPNLDTFTMYGYSDATGALLWTTLLPNANVYDSDLINGFIANGVIYLFGLGGDIYALNIATGAIIWQQTTTAILGSSGADTPYGVWPIWTQAQPVTIADGVLYFPIGHEYSPPLFRGAQEICLNITNGQPIWNVLGFFVDSPAVISDGVMTTINGYDNQIYAFGMGPSKTTVSAPSVGVTTATSITISGMVTDISAGAQQLAVAANFPNGLPCVSDASMTAFMESAYMQQPMPHDITGVPVTFSIIDSNGNYRTIGSTTTNGLGDYSFTWKPDISGNYTVYATFAGTQSYYGSTASTGFYANTPAATPAPTATPLSGVATQTTLMYGIIAIIIVIVIIGAIIVMLMLRKKP